MSIKIHHGPNGSYKTSGAIQDDAVPALKEGRLIITNVRGFTLERVLQEMPNLPESTDIINLDLEKLDDMQRMRTWFQWAPRGAFIIFDETQLVFPKAWREKDIEKFDFPGGPEAAAEADRPMGWLDGWTRHRHWNWDVVLTTPNIAYIRDDIRMTCEMAYKHSNLAVIGIPGRYKEAQHDAQTNRPPVDGTIIEYRKIKQSTFRLYQSTATGKTQDTKAGKSLLKSPKLLFLLAFMACCLGYLASNNGFAMFSGGGIVASSASRDSSAVQSADPAPAKAAPVAAQTNSVTAAAGRVHDVVSNSRPAVPDPVVMDHPFAPRTFVLRAAMTGERDGRTKQIAYFDVVDEEGGYFQQTNTDLFALGYRIQVRNSCVVEISHPAGFKAIAICPPKQRREARPDVMLASGIIRADSAPEQPKRSTGQPYTTVADSEYSSRPWR